jgi:hypothetical protein
LRRFSDHSLKLSLTYAFAVTRKDFLTSKFIACSVGE